MSVSPEEAVRIARKHGLSLQDALSLSRMAESAAQAENLARAFVAPPQFTADDLETMTRQEILGAMADGSLDDLLKGA